MSSYLYSTVKARLTKARVFRDLVAFNAMLFGTKYKVVEVTGVPIGPGDNRRAKWVFNWNPNPHGWDAAFSVTLLKGSRFEFREPSFRDDRWVDQQKVRRRLVRLYNGTSG